jgi:hypothetical protein
MLEPGLPRLAWVHGLAMAPFGSLPVQTIANTRPAMRVCAHAANCDPSPGPGPTAAVVAAELQTVGQVPSIAGYDGHLLASSDLTTLSAAVHLQAAG